ncbi:MAG: isoprenyl transferase [Thermoanaerobacteraceae bacterium]|uniref:Isoprenyl transferase n=2 Tax=Desulfofundulus thermobenzoicus TaxID=29376 RepID=A0A6N7IR12_9FIRM|nr:isoprenyl transferase [Desulfofundulus thermobenzoicus]MBE3587083.1 isoprenyl transferase [Thermoanaerobacteraceae bacterium]MQL52470.1 isoprenyl transferase [Desulfofundulus thermobenzoicus]HHW44583.1 isoprenyl transferase [Desulfotomaculum sp.]
MLKARLDLHRLPRHVAIIMDGNGRWAQRRGLPRTYGHRAGVESLREVVRACAELGIGYLTVYAFSTENWKRPRDEVDILMNLLVEYLHREIDELCANDIRIHPIGRLQELPVSAREALEAACLRTRNNHRLVLNLALNYGGRTELVDAVRTIAQKVARGVLSPGDIDESTIDGHLYTAGQPDPDLLIRPAGDYRVSNFLLWQLSYTEFWMTTVMWPDFRRVHLLQALVDYQRRERRFGGLVRGDRSCSGTGS